MSVFHVGKANKIHNPQGLSFLWCGVYCNIKTGALEPWNFMTSIQLGIRIPTDELHDFSEG